MEEEKTLSEDQKSYTRIPEAVFVVSFILLYFIGVH